MNVSLPKNLSAEDFHAEVGFVATAPALHRLLQRNRLVLEVRQGLNSAALSESLIRTFVSTLMKDLRRGERFKHDLAIAALAVALEDRETPFAEEFLQDLAQLQTAEMSLSIRVARECLKHRSTPGDSHREATEPRNLEVPQGEAH